MNQPATIDGQIITATEVSVDPHMRLIETALSRGVDTVQLEKLMDLQERHEANQAKKAFDKAMVIFQSELPVIQKNGDVRYNSTSYQYATIEGIAHAIKNALEDAGLSYRFTQSQDGSMITVKCIVTHVAGHSESSQLTSLPDVTGGKDHLKSIASAISYLRRYTLTGILGIVVGGEDDDAGAAGGQSAAPKEKEEYVEKRFHTNFDKYSKAIADRIKTADEIIAIIESRYTMTDSQKDTYYQLEADILTQNEA